MSGKHGNDVLLNGTHRTLGAGRTIFCSKLVVLENGRVHEVSTIGEGASIIGANLDANPFAPESGLFDALIGSQRMSDAFMSKESAMGRSGQNEEMIELSIDLRNIKVKISGVQSENFLES